MRFLSSIILTMAALATVYSINKEYRTITGYTMHIKPDTTIFGSYCRISIDSLEVSGVRFNSDSTYSYLFGGSRYSLYDSGYFAFNNGIIMLTSKFADPNNNKYGQHKWVNWTGRELKLEAGKMYYEQTNNGYNPRYFWLKRSGGLKILFDMNKKIGKVGTFNVYYKVYNGIEWFYDDNDSLDGIKVTIDRTVIKDSLILKNER